MRYSSTSEVVLPAHELTRFKSALERNAPSEHGYRDLQVSHISAFKIRPGTSGHAIVRVMIDTYGQEGLDEEARDAAADAVIRTLIKFNTATDIHVTTERVP